MCVLGYCIFPLNIASLVCLVGGHIVWRALVVAVSTANVPLNARPAPTASPVAVAVEPVVVAEEGVIAEAVTVVVEVRVYPTDV